MIDIKVWKYLKQQVIIETIYLFVCNYLEIAIVYIITSRPLAWLLHRALSGKGQARAMPTAGTYGSSGRAFNFSNTITIHCNVME